MSLHERVARSLYEHQRGAGWDDAIELTRDVYLELASVALTATAEWLELATRAAPVAKRLGAVSAIHGVAQMIRRALGQELNPPPPPPPPPPPRPVETESPAKAELREVLEGFGA